jgi:hypothetical protein
MATARLFPKFVASFAARDSFSIQTHVVVGIQGESSAGDLVVFVRPEEAFEGGGAPPPVVKVGLTHNLQDLIRDLVDLFEGASKAGGGEDED